MKYDDRREVGGRRWGDSMRPIPRALTDAPFTRDQAMAAGVTPRMLRGGRFVRVYPRVWRHRGHPMTELDWVLAATLALPERAHVTGITRLQLLGLDFGPRRPLRFVVEGDLHLAVRDIFVHRTRDLPPIDDVGVTPAAAFVSYCATARLIDAVKVGDWLLRRGHMTHAELTALALAQLWRRGADEALWVSHHLDDRSRSLRESEVRALVEAAGLPKPSSNAPIALSERLVVLGDLWFEEWRTVVEYEGEQHQTSRDQYVADIDRYRLMRDQSISYVQVTKEKLATPRAMLREIHRSLVANGYPGGGPDFGAEWDALFARVSDLLGVSRADRSVAQR